MPVWGTLKRNPWTIYVVAAMIFFVVGGLLVWKSTTGVGVGYGLLTVAVLTLSPPGFGIEESVGLGRTIATRTDLAAARTASLTSSAVTGTVGGVKSSGQ